MTGPDLQPHEEIVILDISVKTELTPRSVHSFQYLELLFHTICWYEDSEPLLEMRNGKVLILALCL